MADADNLTLLSANMARIPGATITAAASLSGYFPEFAIDGNRITTWYNDSPSNNGTLYLDCGATLPAAPDRLFINGNCSAYDLYGSTDNATWGTALVTATGKAAAAITTFVGSTSYRYWKLVLKTTITGGAYKALTQWGLYKFEYQFPDLYNPLHRMAPDEAGPQRRRWDGGISRPSVREIRAFSIPIERLTTSDYATLLAWHRAWRNQCGVYAEPTTYPAECYDMMVTDFNLGYLEKYKASGYAGVISLAEY